MNYGFAGGWRKFRLEHTRSPLKKSYFAYSVNFSETSPAEIISYYLAGIGQMQADQKR